MTQVLTKKQIYANSVLNYVQKTLPDSSDNEIADKAFVYADAMLDLSDKEECLSKMEHFAKAALHHLLNKHGDEWSPAELAGRAFSFAEAMISYGNPELPLTALEKFAASALEYAQETMSPASSDTAIAERAYDYAHAMMNIPDK